MESAAKSVSETLVVVGERLSRDAGLARAAEEECLELVIPQDVGEAVELIERLLPAVTLIEHGSPNLDGLEIVEIIRHSKPDLEIVVVAYGGDVEAAIRALRAGVLDYLTHPLDVPKLRNVLRRGVQSSRRRSGPPHILLVEDHEPTRRRLARILEKEGYAVSVAADGEEGLERLRSAPCDLAIVDVRMPGKDGLTVLKEASEAGVDVEIMLTTGHGDLDVVVQALRDGAVNFLRKPIDVEYMLVSIEKALEVRAMRHELARGATAMERIEQLVLRATERSGLVVQASRSGMGAQTRDFLRHLVDSLPLGFVVVREDRSVVYANESVRGRVGSVPARLSSDWLVHLGITGLDEQALADTIAELVAAPNVATRMLTVSRWAFLLLTPVTVNSGDSSGTYVAVVIRGERNIR